MSPSDADNRLVSLIREGDEAAVSEFMDRFRPRLTSISRRIARPDHVDDLVEDVLTTAVLQIRDGRFRGEASLGTWLNGILRRSAAKKHLVVRRGDAYAANVASGWLAPMERVRQLPVQDTMAIWETFSTLPSFHATVLWLHDVDGRTIAEIAILLRRPDGTIGRVLSEAEEMFARHYEGEERQRAGELSHRGEGV